VGDDAGSHTCLNQPGMLQLNFISIHRRGYSVVAFASSNRTSAKSTANNHRANSRGQKISKMVLRSPIGHHLSASTMTAIAAQYDGSLYGGLPVNCLIIRRTL
jgi:hypothetical protein